MRIIKFSAILKVWNFDFRSKIHELSDRITQEYVHSNRFNIRQITKYASVIHHSFRITFYTGLTSFRKILSFPDYRKSASGKYIREYIELSVEYLSRFVRATRTFVLLICKTRRTTSRIELRVWNWINLIVGRFERSRRMRHNDIEDNLIKWIRLLLEQRCFFFYEQWHMHLLFKNIQAHTIVLHYFC